MPGARPPVDQYPAGATLYHLLTGKHVHDFPANFQQRLLKNLAVLSAGRHPTMISRPPAGRAWPGRVTRFLLRRDTRQAFAWLALVVCTAIAGNYAWICYNDPARRDGNFGHATIDFGGQWLMGRMLVTGNGARQAGRRPHPGEADNGGYGY